MAQTTQILSGNARLLKAKASKYAVYGVLIALSAIVVATLAISYLQYDEIGLEYVLAIQKSNVALWILDAMPFAFAFWGQYVSSLMAYEAGAMVVDQTNDLRAQTSVLEQQAMHGATHDALTNLPNRILLRDRIEQALNVAMRERVHLAILIMDLDRFKEINDTLGHYNGDRILKQVATRLQSVVQEPITVARLGGDEFAILLPKIVQLKDASHVVRKIEKALQAPFSLEGLKLDIQASIGVAFFPEHGSDADTLIQRADVAMYVAKKNRSGFVVYSSKLDEHSPHRLTLMGELRQAIEHNQLILHFHPKVNVKTGVITGVEALVRWQHPLHGLMQPDDFIPLAERTGLIKPLTYWVFNHALKQSAAWRVTGIEMSIAVNLSAHDLLDLELPDMIAGLLAAYDIPAQSLTIEITESAIMVDKDRAMQILARLSDMGVRLSIDDFGTGYSSLAYLSKMPVNEIKIDKSFVMDMLGNKSNAVIVHATVELGHNLGLEVVGEGAHDAETLARLTQLGCDTAQGFYLTTPLNADEFVAWVADMTSKGAIKLEGGRYRVERSA